ncbi:Planctomycete cytochrome C [Rubripirellula amarantea]|uniref:Planctomycete cytochrome C n=1 Tax=Rubripirellula amarantea TaxID=2527999 RepID=A0A5C5WUQ8_9BACT|nr:PSD1 and planctomycete cytochrome C domain-containing protein [Rubripirellula amarantea]TWT53552.1 Planctomycete cytochrome C [Rubripirellula amarantea]
MPLLRFLALSIAILSLSVRSSQAQEPLEFGRDVRPILSDHCFACHGPDEGHRESGLRLDTADGLASVVNPQEVESSELMARLVSDDDDTMMPPPQFHKPLSAKQKQVLRDWISSGASFEQHWAFVPPERDHASLKDDSHADAQTPEESVASQSRAAETAARIDEFLDAAIAKSGLTANEPADRRTLLRRVCLDLTGLPPSLKQIDAFLNDTSDNAYEKLIDRLTSSEAYGQHMGRYWLDLVRYADTHGLHLDNYREMWHYRDWVIAAFNANMPFDEFITKQIAGDLLPGSTVDDKIASGFNRLNVTTNEGGSIYEEVFARNCIDRTDAFGTVFLGLTTGCAVCHDHKFDPISQRDYFSMLAFFNSLEGSALDSNRKDPPPVISVPSEEQSELKRKLDLELADIQKEMSEPIASVDAAQVAWERTLSNRGDANVHVIAPIEVTSDRETRMSVRTDHSFEFAESPSDKETTTVVAAIPAGVLWQTLHLTALTDTALTETALTDTAENRVGAASNGNAVLSEISIEIADDSTNGEWTEIPIESAVADVEQDQNNFAVTNAIDGKVDESTGWAVKGHQQTGARNAWFAVPTLIAEGDDAKVRVRLKYQSQYAKHVFRRVRLILSDTTPTLPSEQQIKLGPIHTAGPFEIENESAGYYRHFASQAKEFKADEVFHYEGRPYRWQQRGDFPQVQEIPVPTVRDRSSALIIHQSIEAPKEQDLLLLIGSDDGHVIFMNGKEVSKVQRTGPINALSTEVKLTLQKGNNDLYIKLVNDSGDSTLTYAYRSYALPVPSELMQLAKSDPETRTDATKQSLQKYYRSVYCRHPDWMALVDLEKGTRKAKEDLLAQIPTTLVWKETKEPRKAFLLVRGQYDQPGEEVPRATPSFLPPFPKEFPKDRLGLAKWLTLPEHPLTSRVAANRFWQQVFGTGLVKTSEDFGSQGEPPSHPKLLDFLAVDFQAHGWDVRRLMKSLVLTKAYRRSAKVSETMKQIDPNNRLLARGPRYRLDAEILRDQSLALAGKLVKDSGGPSVKPPQPDGLWKAVGYSGSNTVNFTADVGEKVYRRSVYVFWKRTSPPPQMTTLDAPSRESCTARRERTNTPLQALMLMNETQYMEAARHLVLRAERESDGDDLQRLSWMFELVTCRPPSDSERRELVKLLEDMIIYYDNHLTLTTQFIESSDSRQAAFTVIASTLLNLDEVVNK